MKLSKIFAVAFAAIAIVSCSDDDKKYEINTAPGVTVEMGESEITVVENTGIFNVPIVVNGEPNGYIEVTVQVRDGEYDDVNETEPAIDDAHYYITTKTIRIPSDAREANIQINTQDNDEENFTRVFYMSIASAKGATVANDNYTQVNIKNKSLFNKLGGTWYLSGNNYDGEPFVDQCTMVANDPKEKICYITGLCGYDFVTAGFEFNYDRDTEIASLDLIYGYLSADDLDFGSFIGEMYILGLNNESSGSLPGVLNEDLSEVTFQSSSPGFNIGVFSSGSYKGVFETYTDIKFSRTAPAE